MKDLIVDFFHADTVDGGTVSGELRGLVFDQVVPENAEAARARSKHATDYPNTTDGRPWRYLLIPRDEIEADYSLAWLVQQFGVDDLPGHAKG